jgi:hypothetical protein
MGAMQLREAMIKHLLTGMGSAAVIAALATVSLAQTTQTQTTANPNTKVYAYQKTTAPKKAGPSIAHPSTATSEQLIGSAPFGSPKWWELQGRTSAGEGGQ